MNHIPFDIICELAGMDSGEFKMLHQEHLQACARCRRELALQRSIMKTARTATSEAPSSGFTANVLQAVLHDGKRRWYELLLGNAGNILAVAAVLVFLGYVYRVTGSTGAESVGAAGQTGESFWMQWIDAGAHWMTSQFIFHPSKPGASGISPTLLVTLVLAVGVLLIIDRVVREVFRRSRTEKR